MCGGVSTWCRDVPLVSRPRGALQDLQGGVKHLRGLRNLAGLRLALPEPRRRGAAASERGVQG